jgi:hypothetical protein
MLLVAFIRYSAHSFFGLIFGISKMPLLPEREKGLVDEGKSSLWVR